MNTENNTESNEIFEILFYLFSKKWFFVKLGFFFAIFFSIIALLLPKDMGPPRPPAPPCIWRIKNINTAMTIKIGKQATSNCRSKLGCSGSLPMISTISEIERVRTILNQVYYELKEEHRFSKKRFPYPKVGAVIEVPSAVYQIRRIMEHVDFVSIGSNDLTQYMFAADRNNNRVSYLYNSLHPATLLAFTEICDAGQAAGKPVHICGEIAANPLATMILVAMGIEGFSMNVRSIPVVRKIIGQMDYKQASEITGKVLSCDNSYQVLTYLKSLLQERGLLDLIDPMSNDE